MFNSAVFTSPGLRTFAAIGFLLSGLAPIAVSPAQSREGNRTLRLYHTHTKERGEFTFKKNGRYDRAALDKLNYFLRDWRNNQPTRMDPQLLDLVWAIQQQSGSRDYVYIVSSYRSLATNNMLRARSRGVAEKSQHTAGKAMDFFIPGVPLAKLRAIALKLQVGGVGYYPSSGSPFIHADTGSVRMWPRMSRSQLAAIFPKGDTVYIPSDGKPLAGFALAQAKYGKKSKDVQMAALAGTTPGGGGSRAAVGGEKPNVASWLKRVFTESADEAEENAETGTASSPEPVMPATPPAAAPAEPTILVASAEPAGPAPLPRVRPGQGLAEPAPVPGAETPATTGDSFALASNDPVPLPRSKPGAATATITAATASTARGPHALAELAARMDVSTPVAAEVAPAADFQTASLPAPRAVGPASAVAAANLLGQNGRPAGLPNPRPTAQLAYAEPNRGEVTYETAYGGRYANVPAAKPKTSRLPVAPAVAAVAAPLEGQRAPADAPIGAAQHASLRVDQAVEDSAQEDNEDLRRLMSQLTTRTSAFAKMATPEPTKGAVLFNAPERMASAQGFTKGAALRTDRFEAVAAQPVAAASVGEPGLFQRLFGY